MKRLCVLSLLLFGVMIHAQTNGGDVLGVHNLSASGTGPVKGQSDACLYCHAPHSGVGTPNAALWSQTLSSQTYAAYSSTTLHNAPQQPTLGGSSSLCLSCHDGTVAVGQTQPSGKLMTTGNMNSTDVFGSGLQGSHPFSLKAPLADAPDLVPSLAANHTTADPTHAVKLINNNVECTSCHAPHVQAIDPVSQNFLVRDGSNGQLCLSCHEADARTVSGQNNPLSQWSLSIHAQANNKIANAPVMGSYANVAQNACISCHMPHNSLAGPRLLRGPVPSVNNMDSATQNCMTCHAGGTNISPAILNVYAEFAKIAHPFPAGTNMHDTSETPLLNNNRHATCVDCHSPHASQAVTSFTSPLPPVMRVSQTGVAGISATDGVTVLNPAVNQYENCLRCHGTSSGKQALAVFGYLPTWAVAGADPLNIIPQLTTTSTSSHPVLHNRMSALAQPSLLSNMLNLDGRTQGRPMGTQILCTDCHNSDDNREFGGAGPNGPHGSQYLHVLERRYEFSQVPPAPGRWPRHRHPKFISKSGSGPSSGRSVFALREVS